MISFLRCISGAAFLFGAFVHPAAADTQPAAPATAADLVWISEEYAPFNYTQSGFPRGIGVEVLTRMWQLAGIDARPTDIRFLPWARGYRMAQETPGTCLFTMTVTPERTELFRFIQPLLEASTSIIAATGRNLTITSIRDLDALTVGVVRDDIGEQALLASGARSRIVQTDSARSLVRMLHGGRYDVAAYGLDTFLWNQKLEGLPEGAYAPVYTLMTGTMGYACHKDTDQAVLAPLQDALDQLRKDGVVEQIRQSYLTTP